MKVFDISEFKKKNGLDRVSITSFDPNEINASHRYKLFGRPFEQFYGIEVLIRHWENLVYKDLDDPNGGHHFEKNENGKWIKIKN